MNVTVQQGEIQNKADEAIVVNLFEGVCPGGATRAADQALDGLIQRALDGGDFDGKEGESLLLYTPAGFPARRVLVVGLGKQEEFGLEGVRRAAGLAASTLQELGVPQATTIMHGAGAGSLSPELAAEAVAVASVLACYRFEAYRTRKADRKKRLHRLTILEFDRSRIAACRRGARRGVAIAEATCLARDLANHPGNTVTPSYLARTARSLARRHGLRCRVIDEAGMKRLGMGALLGVARGSAEPARFIVLEYNRTAGKQPLVFAGKGITFDSGGISLKPGANMEDMKFDMSGAAAVLGAMQAVAALKLPGYFVGLVAATENLPSGTSYKPGDILKTMSGKTIEILNTDAEGRLILADTLTYAGRYKPAGVVDLATLTGACVVALGHHASGMIGNDDGLAAQVQQAGETVGERVWPLPLWSAYREQIKSRFADMKNTGGGRDAGAITAAALLAEFAEGFPWVHLDIAGTAYTTESKPYTPKGGTGVGVRLLTQLAREW